MDRDEALTVLQGMGLGKVMTQVGRTTYDEPEGYGPALDRSFAIYISVESLGSSVTTTEVAAEDVYGFTTLMRATTYDLLLPDLAMMVDTSVDAPLTSAKFSQMYRAFRDLRDAAWKETSAYGYGDAGSMDGFRSNLDFLEPSNGAAREWG